MKNEVSIVILAGGAASAKIPHLPLLQKSPAFLPINSRSLGRLVLEFYLEACEHPIVFAVNEEDREECTREFGQYENRVSFVSIKNSESIGQTLEMAVREINSTEVLVNPVTTIPVCFLEKNQVNLEDKKRESENWSAIALEGDRAEFLRKGESTSQMAHSFTGIFRAERNLVVKALTQLDGRSKQDLLRVVESVHSEQPFSFRFSEWLDCGHIQNYAKTRKRIIGSRYFNSISIDDLKGVAEKRSTNKNKLRLEYDYVSSLPEHLKIFFPRMFDYSETNNSASVRMEYYGYPTVAEMMLYWNLPNTVWNDIFDRLSSILSEFQHSRTILSQGVFGEMYFHKVTQRVEDFRKNCSEELKKELVDREQIVINGKKISGWPRLKEQLSKYHPELYREDDCTIVHGDFCFNNVLCDPFSGVVKLIDPRGSFGEQSKGIYGDRKYDWAKFGHSVVGGYDYIVNDHFSPPRRGALGWEFEIYERPWQSYLKSSFWSHAQSAGMKKRVIELIMGTLFVSMTPFHADNERRQIAMFLVGIENLNNAMGEGM